MEFDEVVDALPGACSVEGTLDVVLDDHPDMGPVHCGCGAVAIDDRARSVRHDDAEFEFVGSRTQDRVEVVASVDRSGRRRPERRGGPLPHERDTQSDHPTEQQRDDDGEQHQITSR